MAITVTVMYCTKPLFVVLPLILYCSSVLRLTDASHCNSFLMHSVIALYVAVVHVSIFIFGTREHRRVPQTKPWSTVLLLHPPRSGRVFPIKPQHLLNSHSCSNISPFACTVLHCNVEHFAE